MDKQKTGGHIAYIDALRLLAANMVIVLHCISDFFAYGYAGRKIWWTSVFIGELARCGVPLFFMISGCLLLHSPATASIKGFYRRRLLKFAVPFLIWDAIYYCFFRIRDGLSVWDLDFFRELFKSGSAYHLWFMYALLLLYLGMPFVKRVLDSSGSKAQILLLLLILFQTTLKPLLNTVLHGRLYIFLAEDGVVGYLGYAVFGYILGSRTFSRKAVAVSAVIGVAAWLLFAYLNCTAALEGRGYIWSYAYTVNHYIEAGALFIVMGSLSLKRIEKPLGLLSGLCLPVYFVHVLILELIKPRLSSLPLTLFCSVLFVLTAAISFSFAYALRCAKRLLLRIRTR